MSRAEAAAGGGEDERCRYKGVRRRRWGKWVSEIRVPGTRERLWLGSYATPVAAAVAHDTAVYFLRGGACAGGGDGAALNFPERAAASYGSGAGASAGVCLSPQSVQRVASDAGMAADAQLVAARESAPAPGQYGDRTGTGTGTGTGTAQGGANARHEEFEHYTYAYTYTGSDTISRSTRTSREQLVPGEISVDDIEILM